MALTSSTDTPIGMQAPDFELKDTVSGKDIKTSDYAGKPVLIVFMCNHCPYVVHILDSLIDAAPKLDALGIHIVTISANDVVTHPADHPDKMAELAQAKQFPFPYLFDESQETARAYGAVCTPDLYLFDDSHALFYHGQFDGSRPGSGEASGEDLLAAAEILNQGKPAPNNTSPSVGCGIKWKAA